MAIVQRRGDAWQVRWAEPTVVSTEPTDVEKWERLDTPDGPRWKRWTSRSRTFPMKHDADEFAGERTTAGKRGEKFDDKRMSATSTMKALTDAYIKAAANAKRSTQDNRRWHMGSWLTFCGKDTPVSALSGALVEKYAASLPMDGRKAATRHRKVFEVQLMWKWARGRPDVWPGVPDVIEVVGRAGSGRTVEPPPPVIRMGVPDWNDVDAMIAKIRTGYKHGNRAKRIALLLRYTGMRASQARSMRWEDVVFREQRLDKDGKPTGDHGYIALRAGVEGSKRGATRVIPLHPSLKAAMETWGPQPSGSMFDIDGTGYLGRGRFMWDAFTHAWEASGVDRAKWGVPKGSDPNAPGSRAYASPCHSFRAAVKVGLLRAGVPEVIADYYIGHSSGPTQRAYVPEHAPETSPYWDALIVAVNTIPPHPGGA